METVRSDYDSQPSELKCRPTDVMCQDYASSSLAAKGHIPFTKEMRTCPKEIALSFVLDFAGNELRAAKQQNRRTASQLGSVLTNIFWEMNNLSGTSNVLKTMKMSLLEVQRGL